MYAVPAAQWPIIAATIGTTPLIATCSRNRSPAPANVEPLVAWMRAPAESSSQTIGMRWLSARWRIRRILSSPTAPIDPAITVKSYAATATLRPSISPTPVTEPSAARYRSPRPGSMWSASIPYSTHVPGIEQQVEPLAHEQLAERALPLDELLAAHAERLLPALREVADERPPVVHVAATRGSHGVTLALDAAARPSGPSTPACASPRTRRRPRRRPRTACGS